MNPLHLILLIIWVVVVMTTWVVRNRHDLEQRRGATVCTSNQMKGEVMNGNY